MKAEFDRKLSGVTDALSQSNAQIQQQLQQLILSMQPKATQSQEPEDFYSTNPREYKEKIKAEVLAETSKMQQEAVRKQTTLNSAIHTLSQEYPEIQAAGSDMQRAVLDAHNALPEYLRETSEGYELAVQRAAAKTKTKPKSQRGSSSSDDFSMSSSAPAKRDKKKDSGISDNMLDLARLLGRPVDDPKYKERLEKTAQRKSWKKYE